MAIDIKHIFSSYLKTSLYLLALFFIGWGFTKEQEFFLGLIVGTLAALYSMWLLSKKVEQFGEAVSSGQQVKSLGTLSRFAAAVLAILIALYFEAYINLYGVILGLMASYVVVTINFILLQKKHSQAGKRGE
ncbi:MAG: ATP synthase subunit I [Bacillaceae bacterium]